jgi:triacylglycerol lipase
MNQDAKTLVVFVHGFCGFDVLGLPNLGLSIRYFRKLAHSLKRFPVEAHFPALPPVGTSADRARALGQYVEKLEATSLHLVGHSMGGLDCRYFATHLDHARRVRSVTTVATPHRGSPLADWVGSGRGAFPWVAGGVLQPGLTDLTTDACRRFNDAVIDRDDVHYSSYAGARPVGEMPPWFRPWTRLITRQAGENDSQVSVESARWGAFVKQVRADHLELAGWSLGAPSRSDERPFDHIGLYHEIVDRLIDGFDR